MDNIILAVFPVESEAYQAFAEMKKDVAEGKAVISQAVLFTRGAYTVSTKDSFDSGIETADDTLTDTLIGSCIGILAGPLGVLLGASIGSMVGSVVDGDDFDKNATLLEKISSKMTENATAILALAQEDSTQCLDARFAKYKAAVTRYEAADVQAEIDEADRVARELDKEARAKLRAKKAEERKAKVEEARKKIAADFDALKAKLTIKG